MARVNLDMCSLKRPFDDQRQPRVREEAAAVAAIIGRAEAGEIDALLTLAARLGDALRTLIVAPGALHLRGES
jgi:hypothetical protein